MGTKQSTCDPCSPGTIASAAGMHECSACTVGFISNNDRTRCMPCPPGQSTENEMGREECTPFTGDHWLFFILAYPLTQNFADLFVNGVSGADGNNNDCTQSSSPCLTIHRAQMFAAPNTSIVIVGTYTTGTTHTNQLCMTTTHTPIQLAPS